MEVFMLASLLIFLVSWVGFLCIALLKLNKLRFTKKGLPPGDMGWPLFGQTTQFLKKGPNFMKNQRARFGPFFKTHILGSPVVISMDPEVNRYILMNEAQGMIAGYPQSMMNILGRCNIAAVHGSHHKYLRAALLYVVSPTMLRDHLLPTIDNAMRSYLSNWADQLIDIQHKAKEMIFISALDQVAGKQAESIRDELMPEFFKIVVGTISIPIDIPGTNYHNALKAKKKILGVLRKLVQERKASKETLVDMLGYLMKEEENKRVLTEEEIIDTVITLLNSGFETVSTTSMMALKYLHDHPKALHELREEHLAIRANKKEEDPITFEDLKSMRFTRAVIFETSRLATIVNGVLRKTTKDLELNGFLIPKGWRIYVYTRELHYDSELYSDPLTFNPWRWVEKNLEGKNYFLLFGKGARMCPGKELGIAEVSTFLHYFLTRYRYEEVGNQKLVSFPRVAVPNGYHVRVSTY
ncbi:hypothetical protein V2J09_003440 [Rumex salicifolius]